MKTLFAVEADSHADIAAADLASHIKALFAACPNLCGFVVEDLGEIHGDAVPYEGANRLAITQMSFGMAFSREEFHQAGNLIAGAVSELLAAEPEAYALLRGRTFARTLH